MRSHDDLDDVIGDVSVMPSDGHVTFGRSWESTPTDLFKTRSIISAYDNFGQKKVRLCIDSF